MALHPDPGVSPRRGRTALAVVAILAVLGVLAFVLIAVSPQSPTPRLATAAGDSAVPGRSSSDRIDDVVRPWVPVGGAPMDGRIRAAHPRILLPGLADWDGVGQPAPMRERALLHAVNGIRADDYPPCSGRGVLGDAACWVITGDEERGLKAVAGLTRFVPAEPQASGRYGDAWVLAWAYDLLTLHPRLDTATRARVESTLADSLRDYLALLDGRSASLWHGRTTLAASAWIVAVVLDPQEPVRRELVRRAQLHFLDVMHALALTGGWPEGYNYWINSRALTITLAVAAYLNGLEHATYADSIRLALERIGLWTIYMTRPDGRIEAVGDEGPRVDLKDETQRIIDLIGQLTRNPVFTSYSRYIRKLRGVAGYYRDYRWQFQLFNDPDVPPVPGVADGTLDGLERLLPLVARFGSGAFDQVVMRTGWGRDDTLITLRAGAVFTHHGHYDAGHFTLFKGGPLVITNATYGGNVAAPHRLHYGVRTVSKNALLVLRPGERIRPSRLMTRNVVDGGQRVIMPTGSAVSSVRDWLDNLGAGRHFEGAEIDLVQVIDKTAVLVRTDLTRAYDSIYFDSQGDGGRVRLVRRDLLYLTDEDRLFIHDRVVSTRAEYTKKVLLHLPRRPRIPELHVLRGTPEAGILQSNAHVFTMTNGDGRLDAVCVAPRDAVLRLVGGPGYAYYVESDGDDSDLDGEDFAEGATIRPWFDNGQWRVEVQPGGARESDDFLLALTPSLTSSPQPRPSVRPLAVDSGAGLAAVTDRSLVLFTPDRLGTPLALRVPGGQRRLVLVGVTGGQRIRLAVDGHAESVAADETGAIVVPLSVSPGQRIGLSAAPASGPR